MDVRSLLWDTARASRKRALPILSFPAVQKMNATVDQLLHSSELMAQAMEIIAHQTDTLAAVSLMDLSVEAEAFGAQVRFCADEVPAVTGQLVASPDDAEALAIPDLSAGRAGIFIEGVRLARQRITDKPVIAGMIGPYSLAGRLMDVTEIMYACFDEPEAVHTVLDKATQYLIRYGQAMQAAGADGLMLAEPLAGVLSPDMAAEFSVPYVRRIIDALQSSHFSIIYHNCGNAVPQMLDALLTQGAAAYHFGNAVHLCDILVRVPEDTLVMGNIDPVAHFTHGTTEDMQTAVAALMAECGPYVNFIPSSGCDIPARASWDNIQTFFAALQR